eukprot:364058-Chlamydomonas_euryale.AAC.3
MVGTHFPSPPTAVCEPAWLLLTVPSLSRVVVLSPVVVNGNPSFPSRVHVGCSPELLPWCAPSRGKCAMRGAHAMVSVAAAWQRPAHASSFGRRQWDGGSGNGCRAGGSRDGRFGLTERAGEIDAATRVVTYAAIVWGA